MVYFYLGGFLISIQYQQTQYAAKTWVVHCPIISSLSMTVGVKDCSCCRPAVSASLLVTFHFQQFLNPGLGLSSLCGAWYHSGSAVLSSTHRVYGFLMSKTMDIYSYKCPRGVGGKDKDFFKGNLGRIRNFGKNYPFLGDILPILGCFWGNFAIFRGVLRKFCL